MSNWGNHCSLIDELVLEVQYVVCVMNVLCFDSPYPRTPEMVMLYPNAPSLDIWFPKRTIETRVASTPFEQPRTCNLNADTVEAGLA